MDLRKKYDRVMRQFKKRQMAHEAPALIRQLVSQRPPDVDCGFCLRSVVTVHTVAPMAKQEVPVWKEWVNASLTWKTCLGQVGLLGHPSQIAP